MATAAEGKIDADELLSGAKHLRAAAPCKDDGKHETEGPTAEELRPITDLYDRHRGDVAAIFAELEENPRKALKYPPQSAEGFARRYLDGGYTCVEAAEAKEGGSESVSHK